MTDEFALWRNRQRFSLNEAAALIVGEVPKLTYDRKIPAQRRVQDRINSARQELLQATETGELEIDLATWSTPGKRHENWITHEVEWTEPKSGTDWSKSMIVRGKLEAWAEKRGIALPIMEQPTRNAKSAAAAGELNPKSEASLLAIVAALAELAELDISNPHSNDPNGAKEQVFAKMHALKLEKMPKVRTIADWLRKARDLERKA